MMKPTRPAATGERFLVLPENRLAFTAVERLARRSARGVSSSLFLYGPPGTGKSHLARHLAREARAAEPPPRVVALTASDLAARFAEASERGRLPAFVRRFRGCDLLICEDLHALARRAETQRLLVAGIDEVLSHGGRVLLTCDRLPGEVAGLQPRLVGRCRGGAVAGLTPPGAASRANLLSHFAAARQIAISPEALRDAADARPASPRELQALLVQMETSARLEKTRIDRAFVRRFLDGDVPRPEVTLSDIARAVARHFGLRVADLRSPARQQGLATPRQCAMYLGRRLTDQPLAAIAAFFGRKNHTAVIHACRRTRTSLDDDPILRQHLAQIGAALGRAWEPEEAPASSE